jgi:hypothetical protein
MPDNSDTRSRRYADELRNPIATRTNFLNLSRALQEAYLKVLTTCDENRLSCRCEMVGGRDFTIVIAPGFSAARYWIDRFAGG